MPNRPNLGVFGRVSDSSGAGTVPVAGMVGTLPGASAATAVLEVWAAGADHVAQLVWSSTARAPVSATAAFITAAGATQYQVQIDWVLPTPRAADGYEIRRADGSLAGTASGEATVQFFDTAPRGLNGAYTVTAVLGSVSSSATATATIDLRPVTPNTPTTSYTAASHSVTIGWTQNAGRTADLFTVKRPDGSTVGIVARNAGGGALSIVDASPLPLNAAYTITASLGAVTATPLSTAAIDVRPDPVTAVTAYYSTSQINIGWTRNASRKADRFEIRRGVDNVLIGTAFGRDTTTWIDANPYVADQWYTVTAVENTTAASAATSPHVVLTAGVAALGAYWYSHPGPPPDPDVYVSWSPPAWGQPDDYVVEIISGLGAYTQILVAGSAVDTAIYGDRDGSGSTVYVTPRLSGIFNPAATVSIYIGA